MMTRLFPRRMVWALVFAAPLLCPGQTGGTLSFEVASVKVSPAPIATKDAYSEGYNAGMRAFVASRGLRVSGRRVEVSDATIRNLIRFAYEVKDYQLVAPSWTNGEKFDVAATMPEGSSRSQAPAMLQTLLAERFHLKLHRETREMPVYALVVDKNGPKLQPADPHPAGGSYSIPPGQGIVRANGISAAVLADRLTPYADRPVIDATGLTGSYDVSLTFTRDLSVTAEDAGPSLANALRDQLGLRLEPRKMKIEVLVIDSGDKLPTEN